MSKESEKQSFALFQREFSRKAGYSAVFKPVIPCGPEEACARVQPDSAFYNPEKKDLVIVDDKDKGRVSLADVDKTCDDMVRGARHVGARTVRGILSVRSRTKVSERVQRAAES